MNILFVGLTGVPYLKRASDTRLLSFAAAFIQENNFVTILNRIPFVKKIERNLEFSLSSNFEIVELFKNYNQRNKLTFILIIILSYLKEFFWIIDRNKKKNIEFIHLYSGHYFEFVHYYIISKIINAKLIYQFVELRSHIRRSGLYHKLNGFLCDRFGYALFDGIIPISTYIDNHVKKLSPKIKTIIIPPICDFEYFKSIEKSKISQPYILFCGSAGYFDVIRMIIDSYNNSLLAKIKYNLKLIINGNQQQKETVLNYIEYKNISIVSDLSYQELALQYINASALLIPIRNSIQDIARFPNKICEYTASKGLIITTNNGEIPYYFTDKKDALIANEYSSKSLSEKLDSMSKMSDKEIDSIKAETFQTGLKYFNIDAYSKKLNSFLHSI